MSKKSKLLERIGNDLKVVSNDINLEEVSLDFLEELTENIKYKVTDGRADTAYHPLENIVMITFIAILSNCNEWTEIYEFGVIHKEWFEKFLDLKYGIPSVSVLNNTMSLIDSNELEEICVRMIITKIGQLSDLLNLSKDDEKDIISYDGKVCRASKRVCTRDGEVLPVNAMTAFNVSKDIPLATKFIEEKTNEIPTGPELIKLLDLTNTISTFDALNTQKETIGAIVDKGGDYVAALKKNQKSTHKDIADYFADEDLYKKAYEECHYEESEKAHGTCEKRTYILTEDIKLINMKKWKNVKSIGLCTREYKENGITKKDTRYYISSLGCDDIRDFCRAVRGEWGIENNLHWQLDVTFKEDKNRTMDKNAQANLNILRKLALNILKLVKPLYKKSLKLIRFRLGQNFEEEIEKILLYLNIEELQKLLPQTQ